MDTDKTTNNSSVSSSGTDTGPSLLKPQIPIVEQKKVPEVVDINQKAPTPEPTKDVPRGNANIPNKIDDLMLVKPMTAVEAEVKNETVKNQNNIQDAWSRYHPVKEELVEDYKGTGIYSYVETPINKTPVVEPVAHPIKMEVRTFKRDVEEAVKYNHVSSVDIALAEQKRRLEQERAAKMNPSTGDDIERFKIIFYIILGLILIGGGIALVYYFIIPAISNTTNKDGVATTTPIGYNLLIAEDKNIINLDKIDISKLPLVLKNMAETNSISQNNIQEIVFSKTNSTGNSESIDSSTFLSLVNIAPPTEIKRDLFKPFVYGLHKLGTNQPFLILYVGAYSSGFNGMWSWQKSMLSDFRNIFNINDSPSIISTSTASSPDNDIFFQSALIGSLNSWIIKNKQGRVILAYTIYNNNTVIISTNTETIKNIIDRIIAGKTQVR